jgi:hypothetical protein
MGIPHFPGPHAVGGGVMTTTVPMLSVCDDGLDCLGFILARGPAGFESFDREEKSLGLFDPRPCP